MTGQSSFVANAYSHRRARASRLAAWGYSPNTKHDYRDDYGWPETLTFDDFYRMYSRSGLAKAAIDKTVDKTWETMPALWESEKPGDTADEKAIAKHFAKRKIWRSLMDTDRRSMVGAYAGAIILLRDGQKLDQPVTALRKGIETLAGIIPAWEGQLDVAEWDITEGSDTYGEPLFFHFNEQAVGDAKNTKLNQTRIHRDRVIIWSDDGTVNCSSALEAGFNDVSDAEKIKGAGGEGFWKSARGAPVVESKEGVTLEDMMRGMGAASADEVRDKLNEKADDFNAGFDKFLMMGGFTVKPLSIALPQPKEFWEPCVQSFAASLSMPFKELIGNITGERASTEDAAGWARTCMGRRENRVMPLIQELVDRLVRWTILPAKDWVVGWTSLLEASPDDKLDRASKMSAINAQSGDEPVFLPDEIRDEAGFKSADEIEGWDEFMREREERKRQEAEDAQTETIPEEVQP
ncbi:anti-CBASS protein Acb1 family protein [Sphingobium sp. WCS2017Hpa-17]|uniref:anti-CBASS protein Acb1 family protein n=1 Tax=Sphingobium sp. WCS2017Hpa-17 TaxID=3073638 RepID=UPI002889AFA3|nr:anti-CBASS Acb1 family protein [Sphingobium sp. WCS2017Hpa-17]